MKVFLTGARGQVGWELHRTLAPLGEIEATDRVGLDLSDESAIRERVRAVRPDWVINAAAYTSVDGAEGDEPTARWLNAEVPRILAEEAARLGAWFVHYSTDYVFDGTATRPYREDDPVRPLGVYGATKRAGEEGVTAVGGAHLIFRLAWVFSGRARNFLRTVRRLAREQEELRIVADQVGTPTWARAVADATVAVMRRSPAKEASGIYHLSGGSSCSWHEFAVSILASDPDPGTIRARDIRAITTVEFPTPARRPAYSVLDASRVAAAFGVRLDPWEDQLQHCVADRTAWDPL